MIKKERKIIMRGTCSRHRGVHIQRASCIGFRAGGPRAPQLKPEIKAKEKTQAEKADKSEPNTDKKS